MYSCDILSKQLLISIFRIHLGGFGLSSKVRNLRTASCVPRNFRDPNEYISLASSIIGSKARNINACNALSKKVGIPRGLSSFEFRLGIQTRLILLALYFLELKITFLKSDIALAFK
jgi:hypothetical protein